jgi:hypothetical protein
MLFNSIVPIRKTRILKRHAKYFKAYVNKHCAMSKPIVGEIFIPYLKWGQISPSSWISDFGLWIGPRTLSLDQMLQPSIYIY